MRNTYTIELPASRVIELLWQRGDLSLSSFLDSAPSELKLRGIEVDGPIVKITLQLHHTDNT